MPKQSIQLTQYQTKPYNPRRSSLAKLPTMGNQPPSISLLEDQLPKSTTLSETKAIPVQTSPARANSGGYLRRESASSITGLQHSGPGPLKITTSKQKEGPVKDVRIAEDDEEKDVVWAETSPGRRSSAANDNFFPDDAKEGLFNVRALTLLFLWYFFSFCTLFLNKYILAFLQGEPTLLGGVQMLMTTCLGFVQMYVPCGLYTKHHRKGTPKSFYRNMALVGSMRFSTVVLGLVALKYITVSFTETVKSTAPIFTVLFAWIILREKSGLYVITSLIPVMGGLALCSAYELSFNLVGFAAAIATNLMDCLQNVFSKALISNEEFKFTPAELQFYTSVASIIVQIPSSYFLMDFEHALNDIQSNKMAASLVLNGIMFHFQSITAYSLMNYISPVTHSVANTAKRAILIWLSVLVFGNEVNFLSASGSAIVLIGVLCYNRARDYEVQLRTLEEKRLDKKLVTV